MSNRDSHAVRVKKIRAAKAGADLIVQCDTDVAGGIDEGLPGVVHNGFGAQSLSVAARTGAVQLEEEGQESVVDLTERVYHLGI